MALIGFNGSIHDISLSMRKRLTGKERGGANGWLRFAFALRSGLFRGYVFFGFAKPCRFSSRVEKRANTQVLLPNKVVPADAAQKTLAVTPTAVSPAPTLRAVPSPAAQQDAPATDATVPGRGKVVRLSAEEMETGGLGTYDPMNPARSREVRPLPQLRFIPKAEPVRGDEVIRFEDEGSRL
jgi:hypothetical protein